MNFLRSRFYGHLQIPVPLEPAQRRLRLLNILLATIGICAIVVLVIAVMLYPVGNEVERADLRQLCTITLVTLGALGIIYAIGRWISIHGASILFLLFLTTAIALSDSPINVVEGRSLVAFAIPIVAAGILLPSWNSFVLAGISSLVILAIGAAIPGFPRNLVGIVIFFAIATVTWLYARTIEQANDALRASHARLHASEISFRLLFANNPLPMWVYDRDTLAFIEVNEAAVDHYGYSRAEFMSMHLADIRPAAEVAQLAAGLAERRSALQHSGIWHHQRRNGTVIAVEITSHLLDYQGRSAVLVVAEDVTEREAAAKALQKMNVELEERVASRTAELSLANAALARASRLKDEFLANMSHELRTPLSSILGATEALQDGVYGALQEPQQRTIGRVRTSAQHLLGLINDILDLSKVEADRLALDIEPLIVGAVGQASLQFVSEEAARKHIALTSSTTPEDLQVCADRQRLIQILVNLLSNAVKFTPEGGSVGLDVEGDPQHAQVRFAVWDTGIGIADADRMRLFQPFEQLDSSLARRYRGTGLGLVLVRRLTELHGGTVEFASTPGQGSRFVVTLPWSCTPEPSPGAPEIVT